MARDRLKERLTGAVALLLLGVIAWFWLLRTEEAAAPVAEETAIPPAPVIEPFSVPQPQPPEELMQAAPPAISGREVPADQPVEEYVPPPDEPVDSADSAQPAGSSEAGQTTRQEEPAAREAPAEQQFALDENGLPVAWVVQVASLSSNANAERLVKDLQAAGFKAYSRQVSAAGATVQRVYVGPKLSREAAEAQRDSIASAFQLKPLVVRFEP